MFDEHEPTKPELNADLAAVEKQLARFTPAAPRIDRDWLMFEAGRAAARPTWPVHIAGPSWAGSRFWPAATTAMTAATLLLATLLVWQRQTMLVAQQSAKPQADATATNNRGKANFSLAVEQTPRFEQPWQFTQYPSGYLGVRYIALTQGVGALEGQYPAAGGGDRDSSRDVVPTQRDMLNELLPSSHGKTDSQS